MKKFTLALSVVLMMVLLAMTAMATPVSFTADENSAFTFSYTGTPDAYYAVVVVEGIAEEGTAPSITETSIQYIDQKTAGATGEVTFSNVRLKTDGTASTVYLGGSDLQSAVLLGWVNQAADNFTVSGTVTSASSKEATVTLTSNTDTSKVFTVNTAAGAYTVSVPADTYKFVVTKAAHLSYTKNALEVAADVVKDVTIAGGDVDADAQIGFGDLVEILATYATVSENYDVDGNGSVDFNDLVAVLANYSQVAVVE